MCENTERADEPRFAERLVKKHDVAGVGWHLERTYGRYSRLDDLRFVLALTRKLTVGNVLAFLVPVNCSHST